MVGNLVSGKRIAQASGRDLGQIEDNDQARKVSMLGVQTVGRVAVAQTGGRSRDWQAGGWCLGSSPWACSRALASSFAPAVTMPDSSLQPCRTVSVL